MSPPNFRYIFRFTCLLITHNYDGPFSQLSLSICLFIVYFTIFTCIGTRFNSITWSNAWHFENTLRRSSHRSWLWSSTRNMWLIPSRGLHWNMRLWSGHGAAALWNCWPLIGWLTLAWKILKQTFWVTSINLATTTKIWLVFMAASHTSPQ